MPPIKSNNNNMKGTRPLTGPALTNDLCGQYVKVNVNVNLFISASANAVLVLTY